MNSVKTEVKTNSKLMANLGWKNGELIDALRKVCDDNVSKESTIPL